MLLSEKNTSRRQENLLTARGVLVGGVAKLEARSSTEAELSAAEATAELATAELAAAEATAELAAAEATAELAAAEAALELAAEAALELAAAEAALELAAEATLEPLIVTPVAALEAVVVALIVALVIPTAHAAGVAEAAGEGRPAELPVGKSRLGRKAIIWSKLGGGLGAGGKKNSERQSQQAQRGVPTFVMQHGNSPKTIRTSYGGWRQLFPVNLFSLSPVDTSSKSLTRYQSFSWPAVEDSSCDGWQRASINCFVASHDPICCTYPAGSLPLPAGFNAMKFSIPAALVLAPSLIAAFPDPVPVDSGKLPPPATGAVDFARDIRPILSRSCVACHGAEKQRGGLRLDSRAQAMKGSNSGPVLVPGDGSKSRLLHVVSGLDPEVQMPPKGRPSLSRSELGQLRAWIDQGAKWSDDATANEQRPKSDHWAFKPPRRPPLPRVKKEAWIRNDLDRFILARLEKEGLSPNPEAERATLIRRLSLDLLGLPPTPAEVDAFVSDPSPDAYERLVERLLNSPHYGERWGRHWLDGARYADSDGYEKDGGRPFAWRWRNWVIDALNRDLPYDQFIVEQLAGDLLPGATLENKIATGFHRNTLTNTEGGADKEQFRVEACVDRVNTTARVFMGLTLGCAQCHDHKYDPFTQREYYQFFAFFDSDVEANIPAPTAEAESQHKQLKAAHDGRRLELVKAIEALQEKWEQGLKPGDVEKLPAAVKDAIKVAPANRSAAQKKTISDHHGKADKSATSAVQKLAAHDKAAPQMPIAMTLALGNPRKTHLMLRGDFLRKGVEVQAGTPAILPALQGVSSSKTSSRLDLARWIASPDNPLTARVIANWAWQRYFGRGLVATLEDFGTQGEKPSHPELLDWLATEVVRQKWSLKALHRLIVTSATYRQASTVRAELLLRDPFNILLARQSRLRLEAEIVRDSALASSGLLVPAIGGPSVRPPQPPGISELTYAGSAKWVESMGPDRYRRGLYIWFQRTSPYPMLMTFDAPDSNVCVVRREKSNSPLQALTLLNDTVFVECAQALGKRIVDEGPGGTLEARARHGFRLALGREPSAAELQRLVALTRELLLLADAQPAEATKLLGKYAPKHALPTEAAAWVAVARALLNLDEFVTRE